MYYTFVSGEVRMKLSIVYKCRHCGHVIGSLKQELFSTSMLSSEILTEAEKQNVLEYKNNGDVHFKVICESCEDSLAQHPDYYELEYFIQ